MDSSSVTWNPTFFDGGFMRSVQSRKLRSGMNVGDAVCKYGRFTGHTCGVILDIGVCPDYVDCCNSTFIRARKNDYGTMVFNTDSGGPVFLNNQAYGLTSGRQTVGTSGRIDLIFMPQQFINDGMEVMIAP